MSLLKILSLLFLLIIGVKSYSQSMHCIKVETSRKLVRDALRSYVQDTLLLKQGSLIVSLQEQNQLLFNDFNNRLGNANNQIKNLNETIFLEQTIKESFKAESEYNRSRFRKERFKKWLTFAGGLVVGGAVGILSYSN